MSDGLILYVNVYANAMNDSMKMFPSGIAPDKDWKQLGIYPPRFGLIGYFKLGISSFCIGYPSENK